VTVPASLFNEGTELLDCPDADADLVRRNLRDLERANRWLGGRRALDVGLRDVLGEVRPGTRLTLFDVGTGAGDLPAYCRSWAARRGLDLSPVALERIPAAATVSAGTGLPTFMASAEALPVRARSVDVVLLSQVVHHFHPDAAVGLLRACDAVARHGVIVVDLERARAAGLAYRLAARLLRFHEVTIDDGLTSIARGLSPASLQALLVRAGIAGRVRRVAPYRVVATWRTRHVGTEA